MVFRVGLVAESGSGKDTLYRLVHPRLTGRGYKVDRGSFGDGVRLELNGIHEIPLEHMENPRTKEKYRTLMNNHGEKRRAVNPNYWVDFALARTAPALDIEVFTDVRYLNEAEAMDLLVWIEPHGFNEDPPNSNQQLSMKDCDVAILNCFMYSTLTADALLDIICDRYLLWRDRRWRNQEFL